MSTSIINFKKLVDIASIRSIIESSIRNLLESEFDLTDSDLIISESSSKNYTLDLFTLDLDPDEDPIADELEDPVNLITLLTESIIDGIVDQCSIKGDFLHLDLYNREKSNNIPMGAKVGTSSISDCIKIEHNNVDDIITDTFYRYRCSIRINDRYITYLLVKTASSLLTYDLIPKCDCDIDYGVNKRFNLLIRPYMSDKLDVEYINSRLKRYLVNRLRLLNLKLNKFEITHSSSNMISLYLHVS
jgi:hypothetical protein